MSEVIGVVCQTCTYSGECPGAALKRVCVCVCVWVLPVLSYQKLLVYSSLYWGSRSSAHAQSMGVFREPFLSGPVVFLPFPPALCIFIHFSGPLWFAGVLRPFAVRIVVLVVFFFKPFMCVFSALYCCVGEAQGGRERGGDWQRREERWR